MGFGLGEGLGEGEGDGLGDGKGLGDGEGLGEGEPTASRSRPRKPSSRNSAALASPSGAKQAQRARAWTSRVARRSIFLLRLSTLSFWRLIQRGSTGRVEWIGVNEAGSHGVAGSESTRRQLV